MGKVHTVQTQGPEFDPQHLPQKNVHTLLNPVQGGGDRQVLGLAGLSSHAKLLVPVRDPVKKQGGC